MARSAGGGGGGAPRVIGLKAKGKGLSRGGQGGGVSGAPAALDGPCPSSSSIITRNTTTAAGAAAPTLTVGAAPWWSGVWAPHVVASAVSGVGSRGRFSAGRWGVAGNIVIAWVLTIPASAAVAWLSWEILSRVL